jgi:hypothetical protein
MGYICNQEIAWRADPVATRCATLCRNMRRSSGELVTSFMGVLKRNGARWSGAAELRISIARVTGITRSVTDYRDHEPNKASILDALNPFFHYLQGMCFGVGGCDLLSVGVVLAIC